MMIGERLKMIRNDNDDTQQTLAEKLKVSKATIQSWEQEKSSPCHEMLIAICQLYHVSSDFLLGLTNDDPFYTKERKMLLNQENRQLLNKFAMFLLADQQKKGK